jgi:HK97 family phage prohead protease
MTSGQWNSHLALNIRYHVILAMKCLAMMQNAADLSRLNDGAPLLFNHDPDRVIGVVERGWINDDDRRGYVSVRFSQNPFAQEVLRDVKDKVLRNVSFGYQINEMEHREDSFVATNWNAHEISVVSIPADPTVGVGRSLDVQPQPQPMEIMDNTPDVAAVQEATKAETQPDFRNHRIMRQAQHG